MTYTSKNKTRSLKAKLILSSAALVATTILATPALAHPDESLPGDFSANVSLTTNYIYRGVTQSDEGPALQGGFDYNVDLFYIGVWASSVEWTGTSIETDFYAGFTPSIGDFSFDFGFLYYGYPDSPDGPEQDFYEFYGAVSTSLTEGLEVGVKLSGSPDFYGESGEAWYPEFNASYTFKEDWSLSAHVGQQSFSDDLYDDYTDWNISLTYATEWGDISVGYYDTTDRIGGDEDDSVVLSFSRSF